MIYERWPDADNGEFSGEADVPWPEPPDITPLDHLNRLIKAFQAAGIRVEREHLGHLTGKSDHKVMIDELARGKYKMWIESASEFEVDRSSYGDLGAMPHVSPHAPMGDPHGYKLPDFFANNKGPTKGQFRKRGKG